MQFLSRFDILELMMTPTFWVNVATVIVVTLLVYWLLTRLIAFVKRGSQPREISTQPQTGCVLS